MIFIEKLLEADLHKSCDFVPENFDIRQAARDQEGAEGARACISYSVLTYLGGSFHDVHIYSQYWGKGGWGSALILRVFLMMCIYSVKTFFHDFSI